MYYKKLAMNMHRLFTRFQFWASGFKVGARRALGFQGLGVLCAQAWIFGSSLQSLIPKGSKYHYGIYL